MLVRVQQYSKLHQLRRMKLARHFQKTRKQYFFQSGARVAGFFDGMKPDPRFTVSSMLAHRHPPSACRQQSGTRSLSWIDRLLGVKVVHAQSYCMGGGECRSEYW